MQGIPTRAKIWMLTMVCCVCSVACGNSDKISRSQAQTLWHALVQQADPANPAAIMGAAETRACPQGGQQTKRMGLLSVRGDNLQLRAALHYNGCTVSDTHFDGELFVGIRSSSAARTSTSHYESTLTGELLIPGRMPAHCVVDLSSTRGMGSGNQAAQYTGTFCGYDAASLGL